MSNIPSFLFRRVSYIMPLSEQKDEHEPVKTICRIPNFNLTIGKLKIYNEDSLELDEMEEKN